MVNSRFVCVAALVLAIVLGSSAAQGVVVVLKEGGALTTGGALDPVFSGVSAANVVQVSVDDTGMINNQAAHYAKQGTVDVWSASSYVAVLTKFDLSSLPAGAIIEKAQIRFYAGNGNSSQKLARVVTHDWTEALATRASPNGLSSPSWGPAGDSIWDTAMDTGPASNFDSCPAGANFAVEDVTADVQAFVNGTLPNYGWAMFQTLMAYGNHNYITSENADDGRRPALFISYTPEPATLVLLAISGLVILRRNV